VTDLHPRVLRMVAKQRQRALDDLDAGDHAGDAASVARRRDLERAAGQTVAAAEARRRRPRPARAR